MIYIKNICRSDEKLIVEKYAHNEQSFYRFECCFVETMSILFLSFHLKQFCDVYFFLQTFIMKLLRISFSQYFYFVSLSVIISLPRI